MLAVCCIFQVLELGPPVAPLQLTMQSLFHERVTFEDFRRLFVWTRNGVKYPVIDAVLKNEESLPLIKYAVDILAWQAVVFKVIKSGSITREEAGLITNADVVLRIESIKSRMQAQAVLDKFVVAFNSTITLPGNLLQCATNIFVTQAGVVDLGCSEGASAPRSMSESECIAFALPNSLQNGLEFVDPRGLCTIFILNKLKEMQELIAEALLGIQTQENWDEQDDSFIANSSSSGSSGSSNVDVEETVAPKGCVSRPPHSSHHLWCLVACWLMTEKPSSCPPCRPRQQVTLSVVMSCGVCCAMRKSWYLLELLF